MNREQHSTDLQTCWLRDRLERNNKVSARFEIRLGIQFSGEFGVHPNICYVGPPRCLYSTGECEWPRFTAVSSATHSRALSGAITKINAKWCLECWSGSPCLALVCWLERERDRERESKALYLFLPSGSEDLWTEECISRKELFAAGRLPLLFLSCVSGYKERD